MLSIHNSPDGPAACSATHGRCPYGSASEHFATIEEAMDAYEAKMGGAVPPPATQKGTDSLFTPHAPLSSPPLSAFRGLKGIEVADGHRLFTLKHILAATVTRGADEDGAYLRFELTTKWLTPGVSADDTVEESVSLFVTEEGEGVLTDVAGSTEEFPLTAEQLKPLRARLGL